MKLVCAACCLLLAACGETGVSLEALGDGGAVPTSEQWQQLFGTEGDDLGLGVDIGPDGDIYLCGATDGALAGASSGGTDLFVERRSATAGETRWTRQLGSTGRDQAMAVSVGQDGTVFIGGMTTGELFGDAPRLVGGYVAALSAQGELRWTARLGEGSVNRVRAAPDGGVYVVGNQESEAGQDAYVAHVTKAGERWRTPFASAGFDAATDVRWDDAGIYVAGFCGNALPSQRSVGDSDAFVAFLDHAGEVRWLRQFGSTQFDSATRVFLHAGGIFAMGYTAGDAATGGHRGDNDVFLARFDRKGETEWLRQWGTEGSEAAYGVAARDEAHLAIVGRIDAAAWPGSVQGGAGDAFLLEATSTGEVTALEQRGTAAIDEFQDIAVLHDGAYVVVGYSAGSPGALIGNGRRDVWLARVESPGSPLGAGPDTPSNTR